MSDFRVDIQGLPAFRAKLRRTPELLRGEMLRSGTRIVIAGERQSKRFVPYLTRHLMRSIAHRVTPFSGGVRGEWGTAVSYAQKAHEQRASAANQARGRGPGYMTKALDVIRPLIPREFNAAIQRALKAAGFR